MSVRRLFASLLYEGQLDDADLLADIEQSCWALAEDDRAGRRWSKEHGYRGYTSYASLNDLPIREADRKFRWPLGRRPDDHPGLSELGL